MLSPQNECPPRLFESKLFMYAAWGFYYSKFIEYLDTAWLILKGKPASFLQKLHHSGAPWDLYFQLVLQVRASSNSPPPPRRRPS